MNRVIDFVKKEIVLVISFILAIVSMFFVTPDEKYIDYIDYRTLGLLFCLMTIMAGLNRLGVFKLMAEKLIHKVHTIRGVTLTLVLLCFFTSMVITNDVTLITFVPFTIILLEISHQKSKLRRWSPSRSARTWSRSFMICSPPKPRSFPSASLSPCMGNMAFS